ncbi:Hpt domain-containing protein, partial [Herbaspirillum lusitanum]|uniref:Hpt domain-containing protein n=1 Tax=Herbaspirillum lusitanum TaxID=213312 RepID=UPI00187267D1
MSSPDLQQMTMLELFRHEVESQVQVLNAGLLELERHAGDIDPGQLAEPLEACMRAAHSLKGAARIITLNAGVNVAHVMEDCFVLAQQGKLSLRRRQIDALFKGVDLLVRIANAPGGDETWGDKEGKPEIDAFMLALSAAMTDDSEDQADELVDTTPVETAAIDIAIPAATAPADSRDGAHAGGAQVALNEVRAP